MTWWQWILLGLGVVVLTALDLAGDDRRAQIERMRWDD